MATNSSQPWTTSGVDQPSTRRSPLPGFRVQFGVVALATVILAIGFGIVFFTSPRQPRTNVSAVAATSPPPKAPTPPSTLSPRKSLTELSSTVVQIRRFAATGEPCSNSSGVVLTADGLILTSFQGVASTPACDNPDLLIALVDGTDSAPKVRFRAHIAADNPALDLAVIQIDRDSQGRRVPPPSLTAVELSRALIPVEGTAVRTLAFSQAESATLSVLSGTAVVPATDATWLNLSAPIPSGGVGAGVFDVSGHLVGIVTQSGWTDVLTQARPIALAAPLLQRVGVDYGSTAASPTQ